MGQHESNGNGLKAEQALKSRFYFGISFGDCLIYVVQFSFFFIVGFFVVCFLVFYFFWFVGVYSNVVGICLFLCCVCSLLLGDIRVVSDIVNQRFSFLSDSHFRGWGLRWQWACIRHRESTGYGFEAW